MMTSGRVRGAGSQALQLGAARIVAAGAAAVWIVVSARLLPREEFADLAVLLALAVVVVAACDLGYSVVLVVAARASPSEIRRVVGVAVRHRSIASLVGGVALLVLFQLVGEAPRPVASLAFAVSVWATLAHTAYAAALRGLGDVRTEMFSEVTSRLVVLGVGSAALALGAGVSTAAVIYAAADLGSFALLRWRFRHLAPGAGPSSSTDPVRPSRGLAIGLPLGTAYWRADVWLLALVAGPTEVALYAAAYRLLDGTLLAPSAVGAITAREVTGVSAREIRRTVVRLSALAVGLSLPIVVVGVVVPDAVMAALFGTDFREGKDMLVLLLLAAIPSSIVIVATQAVGAHRAPALPRLMGAALVLNVALNVVLMPRLGGAGAAISTLVCQSGLAAALAHTLRSVAR